MAFERSVFINCPFDAAYLPLLRPLLFTVIYLGLKPRIALEAIDSGQARLDKIVRLIGASQFAIHDLSRIESSKVGEAFRLNMPFELGIDFGCRQFGRGRLRDKRTLVLASDPHRYKAAISDLAGMDVESHSDEPYRVIGSVRNWLKNACLAQAPGAARVSSAFTDFMARNYDELIARGFSSDDVETLPVPELVEYMERWVAANAPDAVTGSIQRGSRSRS
jgi:hypothetical protein